MVAHSVMMEMVGSQQDRLLKTQEANQIRKEIENAGSGWEETAEGGSVIEAPLEASYA